ncbi:hypothetical protein DAEQUDRAFT_507764 [Daedalea quercina L-15889]|uniref:Uncharacterized protein n=1 Tax=Daedalea quercina L-15889 TaxID=1314783 RepID=A0A165T9V9_9APHY|nr:hypothetical protein DAEQUDRAFT_507764 [Daedalea quercina L-15889]
MCPHINPRCTSPRSPSRSALYPLLTSMAVTTVSGKFSGPPTASQTFGTLRLAERDTNGRHRPRPKSPSRPPQASISARRTPDSDTSTLQSEERCCARVTGFDRYAATAIRTASTAGEDVLALSWAGCDSVMSLMKRIEDLVCIPLMYWRLACGSEVLDPAASTFTHPQFLKGPVVDLVLVPLGALDQFLDEQFPAASGASSDASRSAASGAPNHRSSSLILVDDPHNGLSSTWS